MVDERGRFAERRYSDHSDGRAAYVVTIVFASIAVAFVTGYGAGMTTRAPPIMLDCPSTDPVAAYESVSP